jgi:hypothetical protein
MRFLVISYYGKPLNSITALRMHTLSSILSNDHKVDLVTKKWEGSENTWSEMLASTSGEKKVTKTGNLSHHQLTYKRVEFNKNPVNRKLRSMSRVFNHEIVKDINCRQFFNYCNKLLEVRHYDFIIVSSPPISIVSLGAELSQIHKVKLIVDFRDLYNHILLKKNHVLSLREKAEMIVLQGFLKHHLRQANLITYATETFGTFMQKIGFSNGELILNGFESELFENLKDEHIPTFDITLVGTVYPKQNIKLILDVFSDFLDNNLNGEIRINFIGTNCIPEVGDQIKKALPYSFVYVTDKMDRKRALQIAKNSQILFYMGWEGYKSVYSGKIFEYLGLQKNILIVPSDRDVIDSLITNTHSGLSTSDKSEAASFLNKKYKEWSLNGSLKLKGVGINTYSRENQFQPLIEHLIKKIN